MNIHFKYTLLVIINILSCVYNCDAQTRTSTSLSKIVLDAGHGGRDPGARIGKSYEKDIALDITKRVGQLLKERVFNVDVTYTRKSDIFVPLYQRAEIANKAKAQLFISIHANYCGANSVVGTETFTLGNHQSEENLAVAQKENAVILLESDHSKRYEGFDPNDPVSYVLFELLQSEYQGQSIGFAEHIEEQFEAYAKRKSRGVKQAGFLVLRETSMPSVLIEVGFMSNPNELRYMMSKKGKEEIAFSIFKALLKYKAQFDARSDYQTATPSHHIETELKSSCHYSIQISASRKDIKLKPYNFKGLAPIKKVRSGKIKKYLYGHFKSKQQAMNALRKAQLKYKDAFVVKVGNGIVSLP